MQAWPWSPIHDVETERYGPLTWHASGAQHEGWRVNAGPGGLSLRGNADPHSGIVLGGSLDRRWLVQRITAEIEVHAIAAGNGFAGLLVAETGDQQLMMGLAGGDALLLFRKQGNAAELVGQCPLAAHPSGERNRMCLQVILFDASVVLFANGEYLCTLTDADLIGPSSTIGFHLNGLSEATLTRLTVEAVGARAG